MNEGVRPGEVERPWPTDQGLGVARASLVGRGWPASARQEHAGSASRPSSANCARMAVISRMSRAVPWRATGGGQVRRNGRADGRRAGWNRHQGPPEDPPRRGKFRRTAAVARSVVSPPLAWRPDAEAPAWYLPATETGTGRAFRERWRRPCSPAAKRLTGRGTRTDGSIPPGHRTYTGRLSGDSVLSSKLTA